MWTYITWRYKLVIEVKRPGEESVKKATKTFRFIFSLKYFNQSITDSLFLTQDPEFCESLHFVLLKSNSLYLLHRRKRCRWTSANMTILKLIIVFFLSYFFCRNTIVIIIFFLQKIFATQSFFLNSVIDSKLCYLYRFLNVEYFCKPFKDRLYENINI